MNKIIPAAIALTLITGPAFAQATTTPATTTPAASPLVEIEKDDTAIGSLSMTVDQIDDLNVIDAQGNTIGEIDEVLGTSDGQPTAVVIEAGGFLGVGSKDVIVQIDQLQKNGDDLVLNMTKAQIEAMPAWNN